jgi:DNA gyrase subunit B
VVTLNPDGSCTVRDDGRGLPTDIQGDQGVSAAEVIMSQLHDGLRFHLSSYVSSKLHGVGMVVVNALSTWLKLRIRGGQEHFIKFTDGEAKTPLAVVGDAGDKRGTEVTFLRELALLTSGVRILLEDQRHAVEKRAEIRSG